MKEWEIGEVARRLHQQIQAHDTHVVWFLGAGCSITSGIPGAARLVQKWMDELRDLKQDAFEPWVESKCPDWESDPAAAYGLVIDERFGGSRRARQDEIARLVREMEPGFGYACLAQLMTHEEFGRRNNLAFTTNFDDLIADAMYLYTLQKPLTVVHEALAGFLRSSEVTPLVVKLHGDAQLAPKNTVSETNELDGQLTAALRRVLRDTVIVFMGYGGNDQSIATFLKGCTRDEVAGAYWVNPELPGNDDFRDWLTGLEGAVHVNHQDFDSFMAELHAEFDLGRPDFDRFNRLRDRYRATAEQLMGASDRGSEAAERALSSLDAWGLDAEARTLGYRDLARREDLHRKAIAAEPDNARIAANLGGYLFSLARLEEAEPVLRSAAAIPPHEPGISALLGLLLQAMGDPDTGASLIAGALAEEPGNSHIVATEALFQRKQGDLEKAEEGYERALSLDPGNFAILANLAELLISLDRFGEAIDILDRADAADDGQLPYFDTRMEMAFYRYVIDPSPARLRAVEGQILAGGGSPIWDFSSVIAAALRASHEDTGFLETLASVCKLVEPIEALQGFTEWAAR